MRSPIAYFVTHADKMFEATVLITYWASTETSSKIQISSAATSLDFRFRVQNVAASTFHFQTA